MKDEMKSPSNFKRLVLGCIDSSDSDQILIFSGFSRSTRFSFLCTAPHSNICQFFVFIFAKFPPNFIIFCKFWINFTCFRADFDENLSEFHGIEKCFTKFRRNLKFWRIRGEGVAKKAEIISAKSLIFRSGGWPVLFSRARGHVIDYIIFQRYAWR